MCYRLGYLTAYPFNIDIHLDRIVHTGSEKLSFYRVPRKGETENRFVKDLFMIPGLISVFFMGAYQVQIAYGPAFARDTIISQVLTVIRMHFCPMEEMYEFDPITHSREKGTIFKGLPADQLKMFPPLFDSIDFDITL